MPKPPPTGVTKAKGRIERLQGTQYNTENHTGVSQDAGNLPRWFPVVSGSRKPERAQSTHTHTNQNSFQRMELKSTKGWICVPVCFREPNLQIPSRKELCRKKCACRAVTRMKIMKNSDQGQGGETVVPGVNRHHSRTPFVAKRLFGWPYIPTTGSITTQSTQVQALLACRQRKGVRAWRFRPGSNQPVCGPREGPAKTESNEERKVVEPREG